MEPTTTALVVGGTLIALAARDKMKAKRKGSRQRQRNERGARGSGNSGSKGGSGIFGAEPMFRPRWNKVGPVEYVEDYEDEYEDEYDSALGAVDDGDDY